MSSSPGRNEVYNSPHSTAQVTSSAIHHAHRPVTGVHRSPQNRDTRKVVPTDERTQSRTRTDGGSLQNSQERFEPPHVGAPSTRTGQNTLAFYELPRSIIPTIFGDESGTLPKLMRVISDLRALQQMTNSRHRFHLFLESEQGELSSAASGRFEHVVTRVVSSPTISLDNVNNGEQVHALVRMLNGISWSRAADETSRRFNNSTGRYLRAETRTIGGDDGNNPVITPDRVEQQYRVGNLHDETADVDNSRAGGEVENDADINAAVRNPMYSNAPFHSDLKLSVTRRPLPDNSVASWFPCHREDLQFPSWFPFQHKEYTTGPQVTGEPLYVTKEAVENFEFLETPQIQWVYRELFEFLFREAKRQRRRGVPSVFKYASFTPPWLRSQIIKGDQGDFANQASIYFTTVVIPDIRKQRSRIGATRLAYILGAFLQNEHTLTRKALVHLLRVLPLSPSLQKTKPRPRIGYMLPLPRATPDSGGARPQTRVSTEIDVETNSTVTRRNDEQLPLPGVSSQRNTVPVMRQKRKNRAPTSQDRTASNLRQVARRLPDEVIDLEGEGNIQNAQERNVRRRLDYGPASKSVILTEGQERVGANAQTRVVPRRRIPPLFSPSSSDEELSRNRSGAGQLSDSGNDCEEREPFEDDDETGVKPNREPPGLVPVTCAFDQQCRFRGVWMMQDERSILSKCKKCLRKIHDLCGGGEFGEQLCPPCKD